MSLEFTFKNIDRVAGSNVMRQIVPIYSSRVFECLGFSPTMSAAHHDKTNPFTEKAVAVNSRLSASGSILPRLYNSH